MDRTDCLEMPVQGPCAVRPSMVGVYFSLYWGYTFFYTLFFTYFNINYAVRATRAAFGRGRGAVGGAMVFLSSWEEEVGKFIFDLMVIFLLLNFTELLSK